MFLSKMETFTKIGTYLRSSEHRMCGISSFALLDTTNVASLQANSFQRFLHAPRAVSCFAPKRAVTKLELLQTGHRRRLFGIMKRSEATDSFGRRDHCSNGIAQKQAFPWIERGRVAEIAIADVTPISVELH